MKRLKTYNQHTEEKKISKTDSVSVKPTKTEAADTFEADEMDGISVVGDEVRVPTPKAED